jgi:hypothetical protein
MVERYGAELPVLVWRDRLSCSRCGGGEIDRPYSCSALDTALQAALREATRS